MKVKTNLKAGLLHRKPVWSSYRILGSILLLLVIAALPSWAQNPVTPNDPWYQLSVPLQSPGQWGLQKIGADYAWNISTGSRDNSNVIVVIDSGIDYLHEDLMANLWTATTNIVTPGGLTCPPGTYGFDLTTTDPWNRCHPWDWDKAAHGTGVAGIIGAVGNNGKGVVGVNWAAKIMAINAAATPDDTVKAINFAVDLKYLFINGGTGTYGANVRVINISRGVNWDPGKDLLTAIQRAGQADILVVASAGNDGSDNYIIPVYPASYNTQPNVISVAATDTNDVLASWQEPKTDANGAVYYITESSNFGAVDLAAPGKDIVTTYRHDLPHPVPQMQGYARHANGTSFAAPFVSGAAALILSACDVDADRLKIDITTNVDPLPFTEIGKTVSNGRLNVYKAMTACFGNVIESSGPFQGYRQYSMEGCGSFEHDYPGWNDPSFSLSSVGCSARTQFGEYYYVTVYLATKKTNPANRWVRFIDPITHDWLPNWLWAGRYAINDWQSK